MATATKQDLDNAIANVNAAIAQFATDFTAGLARLQALIDAGAQPADFQSEVDSLTSATQALTGFDATINAADPTPPSA